MICILRTLISLYRKDLLVIMAILRNACWLLICSSLGLLLPSTTLFAKDRVTALLSLPDNLVDRSREQIGKFFDASQYELQIFTLDEYRLDGQIADREMGIILAAGRDSCMYAAQHLLDHDVLCVLLSHQAFNEILARRTNRPNQRLDAIVIDQPLHRQVNIAHIVFPSLQKFGLLSSLADSESHVDGRGWSISVNSFNQNLAVAPQIVQTISNRDALVAVPDKEVFTTDRLRTVLLTAYGHAKPVIGYSRAYVRAGALITTFTTPSQVFRQASDIINTYTTEDGSSESRVYDPRYFSITHNPSIAKSLGLVTRFRFRAGQDYKDADFAS